MWKRVLSVLLAIGFVFGAPSSIAATVSLDPALQTVGPGEMVMLALDMDASDIAGADDIVGSVRIEFDPNLLSFDGFVLSDSNFFDEAPIVVENGRTTVEVSFMSAPAVQTIGTFNFTALNLGQDTIGIVDPEMPSFSSFVPQSTNQPFIPTLSGASVTVVPVPAAVWLMVGGLGFLGGAARRVKG